MQCNISSREDFGCIIPGFILKMNNISLGAKVMYAILRKFSYKKDYCWPSHRKLAEELTCSISSVKNYLKELANAHLVDIRKEGFATACYYPRTPEGQNVTPSSQVGVAEGIPVAPVHHAANLYQEQVSVSDRGLSDSVIPPHKRYF